MWTRGSQTPIPGATVQYEGRDYRTGESGECTIEIDAVRETTINVTADGYSPMSASAMVRSDERWTFYLIESS